MSVYSDHSSIRLTQTSSNQTKVHLPARLLISAVFRGNSQFYTAKLPALRLALITNIQGWALYKRQTETAIDGKRLANLGLQIPHK